MSNQNVRKNYIQVEKQIKQC